MRRRGRSFALGALLGLLLHGCGSTGGSTSPREVRSVDARPCLPAPHFSTIHQCLFERTCLGVEGCHGCQISHFGLAYDGALGLVDTPVWETAHEDAAPADGGMAYVRVVPGHPEESYLLWKLTGDPRIIGRRMPFGESPISSDWIAAITRWIQNGAPND